MSHLMSATQEKSLSVVHVDLQNIQAPSLVLNVFVALNLCFCADDLLDCVSHAI